MTEAMDEYGHVRSNYAFARRVFFPIYGLDQLIALSIWAGVVVVIWFWTGWSRKFGLFPAFVYVGFIIPQWRSTPYNLLINLNQEQAVSDFLNSARLLRRGSRHNEWVPVGGRLRRWNSATIRLIALPHGLLITGPKRDLSIIAGRVKS